MTDISFPLIICGAYWISAILKIFKIVIEPLSFTITLVILAWLIACFSGRPITVDVPAPYGAPLSSLLYVLGLSLAFRDIMLPSLPKAERKKAKSKG